jgi:phage shock protein PspC (stress-responsive transcriptional regulator)
MHSVHELFRRSGLVRPAEARILGGVCAGLGRKIGLDPWPARWAFLLVLLVVPGSQLLVYPALWIAMPRAEPSLPTTISAEGRPPV